MKAKQLSPTLLTASTIGIFCIVGVFEMFNSTLMSGFHQMQTDVGDTRLNNYFLEHSFQWLVNRDYSGSLWSPSFFYPANEVLAYSDNLFGAAPFYWLLRPVASAPTAFQLWMIAISILNFLCFFRLLRHLKVNTVLSGLGAFLFAFGLPRATKLGHQQLLPQFLTPLALIAVFNFVKKPNKKSLVTFLICSYLQILAGIYLGWFLLLTVPILLFFLYLLNPAARKKLARFWKTSKVFLMSSISGWLLAILLTLLPYLKRSYLTDGRTYEEVDTMLPRVASWFSVPEQSILSPIFSKTPFLSNVFADIPMLHEHHLFMGFVVLLSSLGCVVSLCRNARDWDEPARWIAEACLFTFAAIFLLTLRLPSGVSLWRMVYEVVPGASAIRAVTRIWSVAYCYLLIAILLWANQVFRRRFATSRKRAIAMGLICMIAVCEQITVNQFSFDKAKINQEVAEIETLIQDQCDLAYLAFSPDNPDQPFYSQQLSAMWAGINANVPIINGYSGGSPNSYKDIAQPMTTREVVDWLERPENASAVRAIATSSDRPELCIVGEEATLKADSFLQAATSSSIKGDGLTPSMYRVPLPLE